jgi:hypothetical protein
MQPPIYRRNFKHAPRLEWPPGYRMAIFLKLVVAVLPHWFF